MRRGEYCIRKKIHKVFDQTNLQIDSNRFEQELIYYLEKWDVSEEILRLKNNCNYFLDTLEHSLHTGKKLGFIVQDNRSRSEYFRIQDSIFPNTEARRANEG